MWSGQNEVKQNDGSWSKSVIFISEGDFLLQNETWNLKKNKYNKVKTEILWKKKSKTSVNIYIHAEVFVCVQVKMRLKNDGSWDWKCYFYTWKCVLFLIQNEGILGFIKKRKHPHLQKWKKNLS